MEFRKMLKANPLQLGFPVGMRRKSQIMKWDARQRMMERNFDPLFNLLDQAESLKEEIEMWEGLRSGELKLTNANGKSINYYADSHMSAVKQLSDINMELMKYGYTKPVEDSGKKEKPKFVIKLTK